MKNSTKVRLLVAATLLVSGATVARFMAKGELDWGIASSIALSTFFIGYLAATLGQAYRDRDLIAPTRSNDITET